MTLSLPIACATCLPDKGSAVGQAQGLAILMVSSDMEEVLAVSDRIGVMHEGHLSGILDRKDATEEAIMNLAVGGAK